MSDHRPPPHMRKPNIAGAKMDMQFGGASQLWYWLTDANLAVYEDGHVYTRLTHKFPGDTDAERYETAVKYVEALYALGEEKVLWEEKE